MESIRENIADLATLLVKTSRANENGKLMAVRKKYANKKFARISQIAGKYLVMIPFSRYVKCTQQFRPEMFCDIGE